MKFIIFIVFLYFILNNVIMEYYNKEVYYLYLKYISTPLSYKNNNYFMNNFDEIIKPYFIGNTRNINNTININRYSKNQHSLIKKNIIDDILHKLKQEKPDKTIIDELVKRVIGYVNFDGKPINFHDLIYIDVLTVGGNYFPFFHTDIQWNSFQKNHGFQIWVLLKDDMEIYPRGNMFLLETPTADTAKTIYINQNTIYLRINHGNYIPKILKTYKSLNDISPKISYLNANVGDVFIMNPTTYHCSDPFKRFSKRRALNVRIVYKPKPYLQVFNKYNHYSKLIMYKHWFYIKNQYYTLYFNNNKSKYKFL